MTTPTATLARIRLNERWGQGNMLRAGRNGKDRPIYVEKTYRVDVRIIFLSDAMPASH
jgi:hypothetical protein